MATIERTRDRWNDIAAGYDEFVTPANMRLGAEALERVAVRSGMRLLDVAAGSGALTIPAARLGVRVLATDRSAAMLEHLEARVRAENLTHVQSRPMDACTLELEDDTFDVSASQHGVHDLPQAVREMRRVTKPGGRVALIAHGPPHEVETLGFLTAVMHAVIPGLARTSDELAPPPFRVAERHKLLGALADAGLREISIETIVQRIRFGSGKELWDLVTNSDPAVASLTLRLTAEQKMLVREVMDGMLRERALGQGFALLTDTSNIGIGTK
jgi:ubiquinone/menaquinone biosynthesis C-methylase UbiE